MDKTRAHSPPRQAALRGPYLFFLRQNNIAIRHKTTQDLSWEQSGHFQWCISIVISMAVSSLWSRLLFCMRDRHQEASDSVSISESAWHDLHSLVICMWGLRVMAVIPNCNFVERKGARASLRWRGEINLFYSLLWQKWPSRNSRKCCWNSWIH